MADISFCEDWFEECQLMQEAYQKRHYGEAASLVEREMSRLLDQMLQGLKQFDENPEKIEEQIYDLYRKFEELYDGATADD